MNGSFRARAIVAALASGVGAAACDGGSGGSSMGTPMYGGEQDTDRTMNGVTS